MTPLRERLFNPPNAVPDAGITMRNGWPVTTNNVIEFRPSNIAKQVYRGPDTLSKLVKSTVSYPIDALIIEPPRRLLIKDVISGCAIVFGVSAFEMQQNRRTQPLTTYRQAAIAIACRLTLNSLPQIGHHFNRDHSTVLHAKRKMQPHIDAVAAELGVEAPVIEWARAMRRRIAP